MGVLFKIERNLVKVCWRSLLEEMQIPERESERAPVVLLLPDEKEEADRRESRRHAYVCVFSTCVRRGCGGQWADGGMMKRWERRLYLTVISG